ncbi:hypothetical protein DSCOOX_55020 [Desulfosarcina ovata subsp. ovata]|uniref:Uncharacterized protein n=1 Tax=Desulfosarcina ovata subsp. ovata TaxID=2752305 RepID=A0A5K8AI00_9BACT|nr:hypothetical protein DSCOOX_55020 [Desulfosarcina ovata subsp. ovata]
MLDLERIPGLPVDGPRKQEPGDKKKRPYKPVLVDFEHHLGLRLGSLPSARHYWRAGDADFKNGTLTPASEWVTVTRACYTL